MANASLLTALPKSYFWWLEIVHLAHVISLPSWIHLHCAMKQTPFLRRRQSNGCIRKLTKIIPGLAKEADLASNTGKRHRAADLPGADHTPCAPCHKRKLWVFQR